MEELAQVTINKLFDSVMCVQSPYGNKKTMVWHSDCNVSFVAEFPESYVQGYGYKSYPEYYYCPNCGQKSDGLYSAIAYASNESDVPISIRFRVIKYKTWIDFEMVFSAVRVDSGRQTIYKLKGPSYSDAYTHIIRFDFKNRWAVYIIKESIRKATLERHILDPLTALDQINNLGPLKLINTWSTIRRHRKALKELFKELRIEFERQLSTAVGYKVKDVYVPLSITNTDGFCAGALSNMIWKLSYPDAPSLRTVASSYADWGIPSKTKIASEVSRLVMTGLNFEDAILTHYVKKTCPQLRRLLKKYPGCIAQLVYAIQITSKPDLLVRIIESIRAQRNNSSWLKLDLENGVLFFRAFAAKYGDVQATNLIGKYEAYCIDDSVRIYRLLTRPNKITFWDMRVKARDIHDTLMNLEAMQKSADVVLPAVQSLDGNTNGLQFFVPRTGAELVKISDSLKNCVRTYRDKVLSRDCAIVAVADDSGKLLACLELSKSKVTSMSFNMLVQAKLFANAAVSKNEVVNGAIMQWAKEHRIIPRTTDIDVTAKVI